MPLKALFLVLSIFTSKFCFHYSVIAASVKPSLTYISLSIDFVNFYVKVLFSLLSDSCKCETLHTNCP